MADEVGNVDNQLPYHIHNGVDSAQVSYNNLLDKPTSTTSAAWTLVSYNTASSDTGITINGLNLSSALLYHFVIECRLVTTAGILYGRCNNDSTGNYHAWASQGVRYIGAASVSSTGNATAAAWEMSHNAGSASMHSSLLLAYNSNTPLGTWTTASIGTAGDPTLAPATANGGGFWNKSDNITSMRFEHNSGSNCEWHVWVFKGATS